MRHPLIRAGLILTVFAVITVIASIHAAQQSTSNAGPKPIVQLSIYCMGSSNMQASQSENARYVVKSSQAIQKNKVISGHTDGSDDQCQISEQQGFPGTRTTLHTTTTDGDICHATKSLTIHSHQTATFDCAMTHSPTLADRDIYTHELLGFCLNYNAQQQKCDEWITGVDWK
jgi:hypothetical protein